MGNKMLWAAAAVVAATLAVGAVMYLSKTPFRLVVLFERVGELRPGDPVTWKGFTIGKVEKVEPLVDNSIGVTVRIGEEYASRLTSGSVFTLTETSFLGFVGQNGIDVSTPATAGRPFAIGEKVRGVVPQHTSLIRSGADWTAEQWRQIRDDAAELAKQLRDSPLKAEAEEALGDLGRISGEAARQSREDLKEFQKSHQGELDRLMKRFEELRQAARRKDVKPEMGPEPAQKR